MPFKKSEQSIGKLQKVGYPFAARDLQSRPKMRFETCVKLYFAVYGFICLK